MQWLTSYPRILMLLSPLVWMGRRSLWVYVFHVVLIRYWLGKCCVTPDPVKFLWVVLTLWTLSALSARYLPAFSFPSRR